MQLRLTNRSGFPDTLVQRLAKVAAPHNTGAVHLLLKDTLRTEPFDAICYSKLNPAQVEIAVNTRIDYPYRQRHSPVHRAKGSLDFGWLLGPEELLLGLMAHEFRHAWQARHGQPQNETDADRWALSRLARWRT